MKAYSDNKTVYISDFIKWKYKKRRVKQFRIQLLIAYALCKYSKKTNNKAQILVYINIYYS